MGDRHPVGERNVAALAVVYHCDPDKNSRLRRSASATSVYDGDLDLLRDEEALRYRFVVAVGAAAHRDGENTARKECAVGDGGALVGLVGVVGVMSMAPATVGGQAYPYDANGNVTGGGGRTYVWDTNNQPTSITGPDSVTETYGYDADGGRVSRARAGVTSVYLAGVWEQDIQSGASTKTRAFMVLQGRAIAQRERVASPASDTTIYLHGDHLGSVSAATSSTGAILSRQAFTPWGELRAGGGDVTQTTRDFTGQKKDDTGLLFSNARYYDPKLGRFLSADSIVPGMASGKGGAADTLGQDEHVKLAPLTTDFHEPGFITTVAQEHAFTQAQGFSFQLTDEDKQQGEGAKWQWGPQNPQALNRYSYVLDNPLRYTDPTGHAIEWQVFLAWVKQFFHSQCPACEAWLAYLSFLNGNPIQLVGEFGAFTLDPNRLYGSDLNRIRQYAKGQKANWGRGNSQGYGGLQGAKDLFRRLTGRDPVGEFDRVELDDKLVVFRADSSSGIPKIEVTDYVTEFLEKISFNP